MATVGGEYITASASSAAKAALVKETSGRRLAWIDELAGGGLNMGLLKSVFTSGVPPTARDPNTAQQQTYEDGCAPMITCNYAQLPSKPEADTLKKIAMIGETDAQGRRLLGSFVADPTAADPAAGIFAKDRSLKERIERGDFDGPLIRTLYQQLQTADARCMELHHSPFNAELMPPSLIDLRNAWPSKAGAVRSEAEGPSTEQRERRLYALLESMLARSDDANAFVMRRDLHTAIYDADRELWLQMESGPPKERARFDKANAMIETALRSIFGRGMENYSRGQRFDGKKPNDWILKGMRLSGRTAHDACDSVAASALVDLEAIANES